MAKTTADVPPQVANEHSKATRGQAVSEATGAGYTTTKKMQKAQQGGKSNSQFGLPRSPGKGMPMGPGKGPGVVLRVHISPGGDKDGM
jgi:hypothetical protein